MSDDEVFVLIITAAGTALFWGYWYFLCVAVRDFGRAPRVRVAAMLAPPAAMALLFVVLRLAASHDVRNDGVYLSFYLLFGAAWMGAAPAATGWCGLSLRDDWLERRNPAAAMAGTGFYIGVMASFSGANIGDGPGWWVVLFSGLLSTGAFFGAWGLVALASPVMEAVTVERDVAAGVRVGAFLIGAGVISGRAAAGDWHSVASTLADFGAKAAPLPLYAIAVALSEVALHRSPRPPSRFAGTAWLVVHAGILALYLNWAGPWK